MNFRTVILGLTFLKKMGTITYYQVTKIAWQAWRCNFRTMTTLNNLSIKLNALPNTHAMIKFNCTKQTKLQLTTIKSVFVKAIKLVFAYFIVF